LLLLDSALFDRGEQRCYFERFARGGGEEIVGGVKVREGTASKCLFGEVGSRRSLADRSPIDRESLVMFRRYKVLGSMFSCALAGLSCSSEPLTPVAKGEHEPDGRVVDFARTDALPVPSQQLASQASNATLYPKGAGVPKAVPGQLVVMFKSTGPTRLVQNPQVLLSKGLLLSAAAADRSSSLDVLVQRHRVKALRSLFRDAPFQTGATRLHSRLSASAARRGASAGKLPDFSNVFRVDVPAVLDLEAVAAEFRRDPHVEYAHPNYQVEALYTPNDPYLYSSGSWGQSGFDLWSLKTLGAETAWNSARGAGTVVAVVDTGLDFTHPDIQDNVWNNPDEIPDNGIDDDANGYVDDRTGWDMANDDNDATDGAGHGTHVAGTIAAQDDNGVGVVGVAPDARIMVIKGLDDGGSGSLFSLAESLLYAAANGADVVNNSWGCAGGCPPADLIEDAVAAAYQAGVIVVFAAGNDNLDVKNYSPHARPEVLLVSATSPEDTKASFSNFGYVDVAAPGAGSTNSSVPSPERGILSLKAASCTPPTCEPGLIVGNDYLRQSGTSMAAPHVAGLAAVVLSQHPTYTQEQVRQVIRRSATDIGAASFDTQFGYGRINAAGAVAEPEPLGARLLVPPLIDTPESFALTGVAAGPDFESYRLEYGFGSMPSSWTLIAESTSPVTMGTLASWDVGSVSDGEYTLRLTARTTDARDYEDRRLVVLDRVAITSPVALSDFGNTRIQITGTAAPSGLDRFDLRVQRLADGAPVPNADLTLTGGGTSAVVDGVLGTWNTSNVAADHYRIVLDVTLSNGSSFTHSVPVKVDPLIHEGWPITLDPTDALGIPLNEHAVLADLDNDGTHENIIAYGRDVNVYRHDGTQLPGWPRAVNADGDNAYLLESPAVGNIDDDSGLEVVVPTTSGKILAYDSSGTVQPGWPLQRLPGSYHDASLVDVDQDGRTDVILSESQTGNIEVLRGDGTALPGFPVTAAMGISGGVSAADLDQDGDIELVGLAALVGPCQLVAYDHLGSALPGFPVIAGSAGGEGAYAVLGDIDDDGDREIVVTCAGFANPNAAVVAAYHHTGVPVAGWPKPFQSLQMSPPVLADIDGDGSLEIAAGTGSLQGRGALHVWNGAGTLMPGWPVLSPPTVRTILAFNAPIVFNADSDHRGEVFAGRIHDNYLVEELMPFGPALQAMEHDGATISGLSRPLWGHFKTTAADQAPAVADVDGDGLLELAFFEDQRLTNGKVVAHLWDLDVPASARAPWPMFRGNAQHTGVAETVVPIRTLSEADRDVPVTIDGLARFRVTTGASGIIQVAHPWQAAVTYALGSDAPAPLPNWWGGPVQASPNTTYLLRVTTPSPMSVRISWW
jgi:subtilisin family serine protease